MLKQTFNQIFAAWISKICLLNFTHQNFDALNFFKEKLVPPNAEGYLRLCVKLTFQTAN